MLEHTAIKGSSYAPHKWAINTTTEKQGEKPTYYVSHTTHDGGVALDIFQYIPITGSPVDGILGITHEVMHAYRAYLRGLAAPKAIPVATRTPEQHIIARIVELSGLTQDRIAFICGVSRQQLAAWRRGKAMREGRRQHILQFQDVLQRASRTRSALEVAVWLETPQGNDAKNPAQLLRMKDYDRARFLAVSAPSLAVAAAPEWAKRQFSPAFQADSTGWQEGLPLDRDAELKRLLDESDSENEEE